MSAIIKCKFCEPVMGNTGPLRSYLPDGYEYMVCSLSSQNANFKTRLRTNGKNQEFAHKWLEDFQMYSKCTMRVERTYPHSGTKNVFKIDLRCQHNTRPRSEKVREKDSCKNTDCPAKMGITIKRVVTERKSRSKDPHLPEFPTVIQMDFCHNHAILAPEILKHRSVLPEVKDKILMLFKLGHNPATALDMHKYDLLLEHGENYEKVCQDRALLPDPQFCYRLYYKIVRKQICPLNGEIPDTDLPSSPNSIPDKKLILPLHNCDSPHILNSQNDSFQENMLQNNAMPIGEKKNKKKRKLESSVIDKNEMASQLEDVLCKFCESGGYAGMQLIDDDTVMALCTPLMHRVHTLIRQSGELVFVDAYGELDEPNTCRVLMLVTYSCIGAIPLGCLVTTSATSTCIKAALDLWKQILPEGCFYNKTDGPQFFFTSDSEAERQSLKSSFPESNLLICLSHILQSSWGFLWDRKNAIKKEHRSMLFSKVKMLLFSQTAEELEMNYAYVMQDNLVKTYSIFIDYLKHIYNHRHDWSLVYRRHLLSRANDITVFWEAAMIILKDPILSRTRTYNQLQIIDILSRLDTYYERRLIDLANNRYECVKLSRFLFIDMPREAYTITQKSESEYEVHNDTKDTTYQVDITLGMCECRTGKSGAPCKHQLLVFRNFSISSYDFVSPSTSAEKAHLFHLATGQKIEDETALEISNNVLSEAPEMNMHDLGTCNDSDFFLDENGACESLSHHSAINHSPIVNQNHSSALNHQNNLLHLSPVINQHNSVMNPHDHTPQQNMGMSHHAPVLDHESILHDPPINHPVDSHMNQQLQNINQNPVSMSHAVQTIEPCEIVQRPLTPMQTVMDLLDQASAKLKERTSQSPHIFIPALGTFLKNLESLSSESALEYALYSFGKFSKTATPMFKRKIVDNKLIGLQSAGELKRKRQPLKNAKGLQNNSKNPI